MSATSNNESFILNALKQTVIRNFRSVYPELQLSENSFRYSTVGDSDFTGNDNRDYVYSERLLTPNPAFLNLKKKGGEYHGELELNDGFLALLTYQRKTWVVDK